MLRFLAAALAAATQSPAPEIPTVESSAVESSGAESSGAESPVLESSVSWWERITVTVDDKGKQQSCRYEMSLSPSGAEACGKAMAASVHPAAKGQAGLYSKFTFERRFSPGGQLDAGRLQPGDTLLGRQVMFLTIDAEGSIESCHVVARSGEARPDYDCDEAKKEQFRAHASAGPGPRQGFMTVLAYGHAEEIA